MMKTMKALTYIPGTRYLVCMNRTKIQKLLPIKILEAPYLLVLILLLLFRRKKSIKLSLGPKTPLVACVFYFVLIYTCFWLNVNRYTFFWHFYLIAY